MSSTMRDLERKGEIVTEVAARQPATLKEALRAYAEIREREISRSLWDMDATTEWKARDITYQIAALSEIRRSVAGEDDEPAPKKKGKKPVVALVPAPKSARQQQIDLADVLRVSEYQSTYATALDDLKEAAKAQIIQHTNVRANQAMGSEIDELVRFLQRVEDGAQRAHAELVRDSQRVGSIRDPRQFGGMRSAM